MDKTSGASRTKSEVRRFVGGKMPSWPINLDRDRGMKLTLDLSRVPDDPGRRADVDHALRILAENDMIEGLEWDRKGLRLV
jgi:hypothetical protein